MTYLTKAAVLSCLLIAGCGNGFQAGPVLSSLQQLISTEEALAPLSERLTPAVIADLGQPVAVITLLDRDQEALAIQLNQQAGRVVWSSADGVSVTLQNGVALATRGLGGDLLVADLSEVRPALASGRDGALRVHRTLDGENQIQIRSFICDVSFSGTSTAPGLFGPRNGQLTVEACTGPDISFENRYWRGASGQIFLVEQWISPEIGRLRIEQLTQ